MDENNGVIDKIERDIKLGNRFLKFGLLFWLVESWVFIYIHGFHTSDTALQACLDAGAGVIIFIGLIYWAKTIDLFITSWIKVMRGLNK